MVCELMPFYKDFFLNVNFIKKKKKNLWFILVI